MGLSSDLISQFVKVTKDKTETKKETITYGTVQIQGDTKYVQLDGSDRLTPISNTSNVGNGDRVTVMIKNHTATVTGNLTSPSARYITQPNGKKTVEDLDIDGLIDKIAEFEIVIADKVSTDELEAESARIDNLLAENVTIRDSLEARKAEIDILQANDVTINNKLTAVEAVIDDLDVTYATITELNAVKGTITSLSSDVANIDTLIFGSASGNVIQTSFANSVIAQLGNAQIKSAMIESVSAGKITAGDIITNNVRVKSSDGKLLISDETIQISDTSRVRVQIGKDASNDYSINIWDASGNLMFSKGGITDSAIKSAIIRNDMVSETANISASKLDINSLFEEINDSSKTINASKIYVDGVNKTVDVYFSTLRTDLVGLNNKVTSQGTKISVIEGQISSKIWQQDINTAKNEMSTQYSTLEQDLGSFKTTVGNTYATKTQLNDLTIGGRNLLLHTGGNSLPVMSNGGEYTWSGISNPSSVDGVLTLPCNASNSEIYYRFMQPTGGASKLYGLIPGETYILSGRVKASTTSGSLERICVRTQESVNNAGWTGGINTTILTADTDKWVDFACTFTLSANATGCYVSIQGYYTGSWVGTLVFTGLKLEKGTKATDWTPAPEDMATSDDITSVESSITQLSDRITSNVTETTKLGTRMSTVEQTSAGLTTRLDTLSVGGTNMLKYSNDDPRGSASSPTLVTGAYLGFNAAYLNNSSGTGTPDVSSFSSCVTPSPNTEYTLSFYAKGSGNIHSYFYPDAVASGKSNIGQTTTMADGNIQHALTSNWKKYVITWKTLSNVTGIKNVIPMRAAAGATCYICGVKFEKGNVATDWSPSPVEIDNAAKTATNYLNFSSSGLVIGDHTASTLGKNVLIDSDSVDIRNGTTVLASFGADTIELGKHSPDSVINLCNKIGTIRASTYDPSTNTTYGTYGLFLESPERVCIDSKHARFYSKKYNSDQHLNTSALINNYATDTSGYIYATVRKYEYNQTDGSLTRNNEAGFEAVSYDTIDITDMGEKEPYAMMQAQNSTYLNRFQLYPTFAKLTQKLITTGNISTNKQILIGADAYGNNGRALGVNKVLWSGSWYMTAGHTATLSENVSKQPNGIVLVFSEIVDGAAQNTAFHTIFVPKQVVASHGGVGHCMQLSTSNLAYFATKYLYIHDTKIVGHDNNNLTGSSSSGITRACNRFIMRYVIGV